MTPSKNVQTAIIITAIVETLIIQTGIIGMIPFLTLNAAVITTLFIRTQLKLNVIPVVNNKQLTSKDNTQLVTRATKS